MSDQIIEVIQPSNQVIVSTAGAVGPRGLSGSRPSVINVFTVSGIWRKSRGLQCVIVEVFGGGGGGGGTPSAAHAGAGGGGAGGYARKLIMAESLGDFETVTIGAGGAGGAANESGETGGTTWFGAHVSATGGLGGTGGSVPLSTFLGGLGGEGRDGDVNSFGAPGGCGKRPTTMALWSGGGGSSIVGAGGREVGVNTTGEEGVGHASGGGGAAGLGLAGGAGRPGLVIVTEYTLDVRT